MNKKALLKKIGGVALNVAGLAGSSDKEKALQARLELTELKLAVAIEALEPFAAASEDVRDTLKMLGQG
jgi:hypothetical protein